MPAMPALDGNALLSSCGGGDTVLCICQNSWNQALKWTNVAVCGLNFSKPDVKTQSCPEATSHYRRLRCTLQRERPVLFKLHMQVREIERKPRREGTETTWQPNATCFLDGILDQKVKRPGRASKCQRQDWNPGPSAPKCCSYTLKSFKHTYARQASRS